MPRDARKYLHDVQDCCAFLMEFIQERSIDDYVHNRPFRSTVERELIIVGEAIMQLTQSFPDFAAKITDCKRIIGFRHVLVHGYDTIAPATLWDILTVKVPVLESEARLLLSQLSHDE